MKKQGWIMKFATVRFFLEGCETYMIAPTAWYYIRSLGQTKLFLALVLSSYNFGGIIAGPLTGFITDRLGRPKFIFICCCVMRALAYVIYSVNLSAYFPLFGRFMSGLSNGGIAILLGQVVLQTHENSRGQTFITLSGFYCFGSAFGPGIASLVTFRVDIFGWKINEGNSPGIVLAIAWLLFLIASLFLPNDMWVETDSHKNVPLASSSESEDNQIFAEYHPGDDQELGDYGSEKNPNTEWDSRIICLLFLIFCSEIFSSTSTFYTPVLGLQQFHLQLIHIKLLFLNCTLFTLFVFLSFYIASKYFDERKIFVVALLMQITAISFLAALAFSWDKETSDIQYYVLLVYICLGMPYFAYPFGNSILSKITDTKNASFVQGLSFAALHSAIVISRVSASFVFTKTSLIWYTFVLGICWFVGFTWYAALYRKLIPSY